MGARPEVATRLVHGVDAPDAGQVRTAGGDLVPRGQAILMDALDKPIDLEKNLQKFEQNQKIILQFCSKYLQEAEYKNERSKELIPGKLNDYYQVPGTPTKALTKKGSEKLAQLFRYAKGETKVVNHTETAEYTSASVSVTLLDHYGRVVGSNVSSCSTAEKGFQSIWTRKKYGAWYQDRSDGKETKEVEVRAPDYRAALNDVVARAGKRAFVQAIIYATATDEIFHVADDSRVTQSAAGAQPSGAASVELPFKWGDFAKGTPLADVTQDSLVTLKSWCQKKGKFTDLVEAIDLALDDRRPAAVSEIEAEEAEMAGQ